MNWRMVDEGWGRRAAEFATLLEPGSAREYLHVHQLLDVSPGCRLLDLACGAGLALELARIRGAECAGIDASPRLVEVARLRNPGCDIRVGDMADSGFAAGAFDVVTSFRGVWGTTPDAVTEAFRVLRPGGRLALTFWGDMAAKPGGRLLAPFRLATEEQVAHQSAMVGLKHPGVAARVLSGAGFEPGEVFAVPCVLEFADVEHYTRALASSGPAYEAIHTAGEAAFREACVAAAQPFLRDGLPIRGEIALLGITGRKPGRHQV